MSTLDTVRSQGFDRTSVVRGSRPRSYRPACSACEVLVICGVACHETGCPQAMHLCHGCETTIPIQYRYCEDCR